MEDALEPGVKNAVTEHRNLQALGIGCTLFALLVLLGLKMINRAVRWLP